MIELHKNLGRHFCCVCLLLFAGYPFATAQSQVADSLRIEGYYERLGQHCYTNLDSTLYYLDALLSETERLGWTEEQAYGLLWGILCTGYQGQIDLKYDYLQRAEALLDDPQSKLPDSIRQTVRRDLQLHWGDYYLETGGFNQALAIYEPIAEDLTSRPELDDDAFQRLVVTYQYLASIHRQRGSYREAIDHYFQALEYERQYYRRRGEEAGDNHLTYSRIATAYRLLGDRGRAMHYYRSAFQAVYERYRQDPASKPRIRRRLIAIGLELGDYYREVASTDSALYYLEAVEPLAEPAEPATQEIQLEKARTYSLRGDYATAHLLLNQILAQSSEQPNLSERLRLGQLHNVRAGLYEAEQQFGLALSAYQQALAYLSEDFSSESLRDNPKLSDRLQSRELLHTLTQKSRLLYEHPPGDKEQWLPVAWSTAQLGMDLVDSIKLDFASEYDKQYLLSDSYPLYEQALAITTELGAAYAEDAFRTMERSRSVALMAAVRDLHARDYAGVPNEQLEKLRIVQYQLAKVETQLLEASDEDSQISLREQRQQLQQQYRALIQTLEREHSAYYQLKYQSDIPELAWVQNEMLDEHTRLIEYFIGGDVVYTAVISPGAAEMHKLPWSNELSRWAATLKDDLYRANDANYRQRAAALYDALLAPLFPEQLPERLIIIPDGVLGYLPFEVLLTRTLAADQEADFRSYPYLLRSTAISQCFSTGMLREMQRTRREQGSGLLAFAPSFRPSAMLAERSRDEVLGELLYNQTEAAAIAESFSGRMVADEEATKQRFLELATDYRYYHLASHAVVSDVSPHRSFIAFTDDDQQDSRLYSYEILAHPFPADLVVLSACETGIGQIIRGEGIMSLARAFSYAGARSLVTSLWNINDASSMEVMTAFYRSLRKGLSKDEALRQAKLSYLDSAADQARAHPRYWAAFVPIGNMEPIGAGSRWTIWLLLGIGLLGVMAYLWPKVYTHLKKSLA